MSFGKSSSSMVPTLSPEQREYVKAQTDFYTKTIAPTYKDVVGGAKGIYEENLPGMYKAGHNLAGTAGQVQQTLGETGESALRTGVSGLQGLFGQDYEQNQIQAALAPAQAQYQQNIADQGMRFGGAGNLGSARQALAGQQLAGSAAAQQAQIAAQVANQVAQQRAGVGATLANLGQGGIGQALGAAGQQVSAAMTPQQLYNQYASVIFGTPAASYNPDFRGTQSTSETGSKMGFNAADAFKFF
jgi:hypothetical protein